MSPSWCLARAGIFFSVGEERSAKEQEPVDAERRRQPQRINGSTAGYTRRTQGQNLPRFGQHRSSTRDLRYVIRREESEMA